MAFAPLGIGLDALALERVTAFVGPYGSGKSEIAVNLALGLAAAGQEPTLADLDVVNPYFRSREARERLEHAGVRVLAPPPEVSFADLPILAPGVAALLLGGPPAILDVGGDVPGARVLGIFSGALGQIPHDVLFVVNPSRPYAANAGAALQALRGFEKISRARVTGVVANGHLLDETTEEVVRRGVEVAAETAERAGVRVAFAAVQMALASDLAGRLGVPVLPIERILVPPHLRRSECLG